MSEKEYIERNDLINNRPPQRNPDQTGKEEYNKGYNDGVKAFLNCVKEQPADNNVVKVVRCKDCIHYSSNKPKSQLHRSGYCLLNEEVTDDKRESNDFCSYGERKELDNG